MAGRRAGTGRNVDATQRVHASREPLRHTGGVSFFTQTAPVDSKPIQQAQTLTLEDFPSTDIARCLSPNGRAHWATKKRARAWVATVTSGAARQDGLRPVGGPVRLTLTYVYPDHRKRDIDNLTTGVTKCVIDALVRGCWLDGDDSRTVLSVTALPSVQKGRRALEILIEPVQEV